ncbi:hypothetical protein VPNG_06284 [Cytospora leucostoma]|uniref:Uncharacterized protein n=1 Tax=Cytospora leucostoma TaxID=1230097 RepID=A0A423X298_9PEZI|nr:hypothetical protein VPNG_06284 [Cytospora leucostoma]
MPTAVQIVIHEKDVEALEAAYICGDFLVENASKVEDPAIWQQWSTSAKDYKDNFRDLLKRMKGAIIEADMAEDHNPRGHVKEEPGPKDERATTASLSDDGLPRPRKRARLDPGSFGVNQEAAYNEKEAFFRALAQAQYTHSLDFSEKCTAIKAVAMKRPVPVMGRVKQGNWYPIDVTLLYDMNGTSVFLPPSVVPYFMEFITFVRGLDKEQLTDMMPVFFILKHFLHIKEDFGPVPLAYTDGEDDEDKKVVDIDATLQAWKNKYLSGLCDVSERALATRIVAMRKYMEDYGVAKAGALTYTALADLAGAITSAELDVAYGRGKF